MKVIITGHTSGIGKSTAALLESKNFNITGLSRSMGFDIENNYGLVLDTIINNDPDIFINNAYAPKYQNLLLERIYNKWKLKNKLIGNDQVRFFY